jgi:hypothetical protein
VTGRTRTGFFRGHVPACRPLLLRPQSTREESNLRHPLCKRGGLATDLLVAKLQVGHRGVEPRRPAVSARCRLRLAHAPRAGGPGSARTCSCRASTGRSTVRASGPCALAREPLDLRTRPCRAYGAGGGDRTRSLSVTTRASLPSGPHRQDGPARGGHVGPGRWLPESGLNARLPGNNRTSVPLDHLASIAYRDGESNPGFRDENPAS